MTLKKNLRRALSCFHIFLEQIRQMPQNTPEWISVGGLHTLRLESLKPVFQPLHNIIVNKL
jgi:hypothetical protein